MNSPPPGLFVFLGLCSNLRANAAYSVVNSPALPECVKTGTFGHF